MLDILGYSNFAAMAITPKKTRVYRPRNKEQEFVDQVYINQKDITAIKSALNTQSAGGSFDSPTTTKGDLIVRNATEDVRFPVGANDEILMGDDTTPEGMSWQAILPEDMKYAQYRNESNQSANNTVDTILIWDTIEVENAPFSLASNTVTINEDAIYLLNLNVNLSGTTTINRYGGIVTPHLDDVALPNQFQGGYVRGDSGHRVAQIGGSLILNLTAGQELKFYLRRDSTVSVNTVVDTGSTLSLVQLRGAGPRGVTGLQGADGDMIWKGLWSNGTYLNNDVVQRNGSSYICIEPSTTQEPPGSDWELVAQKGDVGSSSVTMQILELSQLTVQQHDATPDLAINWLQQDTTDSNFSHDIGSNPHQITCNTTGWLDIRYAIGYDQDDTERLNSEAYITINGVRLEKSVSRKTYYRGVSYGKYGDESKAFYHKVTVGDVIELHSGIADGNTGFTLARAVDTVPSMTNIQLRYVGA